MRKFGLAAILTFVDKGATAAMGRIGRRAAMLKAQFAGVGAGVSQMRRGLGSLAMAALPVSAGFGLMLKKGADFEQAIARLKAVTLKGFDPALRGLAKTLGATTAFSATEAADAMTNLARAGLTSKQIIGAIGGTLNAAAAEGIDLATAADMVASNIKAFNMPAEEAGKIAGILALTSARTNTSMVALQEGLKMAAPAVKPLNVSLQQTAALMGALADIGLKGTLGGTGIRAATTQLLNPSKKARKAMAELGVSYADLRKEMDKGNLVGTFQMLVARMKTIPSATKRAALMSRILQIRGTSMAAALNLSDDNAKKFTETLAELNSETGSTADAMRRIQLKTLTGQLTILKSAFEGVSIEMFDLISGETSGLVDRMGRSLGNLALAMRVVSGEKITDPKTLEEVKKVPASFFEIARGIREAFGEIKEIFKSVGESLGGLGKTFGLTGDGSAKSIAKIVTKVVVLTAAFAPLALAVGGVTRLFGGMASTALGAGRAVVGLFGGIFKGAKGLAGAAGKAGGKFSDAFAQPVRVVNFHEMGGLGRAAGLGGTSGARMLDLETRTAAGALTRFRAGLNSLASRIPGIGGMLAANVDKASLAAGGLKGALGKAGLLGAALGAGYALGTFIDRMTGASTRISNFLHERDRKRREELFGKAEAPGSGLNRQIAMMKQTATSAETLNQLIALRGRGMRANVGGSEVEITREFARGRLLATLEQTGLNQKEIASQLTRLAPLLAKLPAAGGGAGTKPPMKPAKDALVSTSGLIPVSAGDVVLDRASLAGAVVSQLRGGLAGRAGAGALGGGDPGRTSPPPASSSGPLRIEVPVEIDGRRIAMAVAEVQLDELERGGASMAPGARRGFLERGLVGGES